ncbi:hypothetical protein Desaci_4399 [Desulfosporosinus acidiphilus SJ4]|uniref:DUF948 domain-containing protein n=1 Tax=Desulfosporosinus acidiphilus (strain DSM 22704 / JCM 16185 / SJ4) TaxID=646529 RepID=I4DBR9_DESAJ|nr:hypothetical protein [Desulfosporosinus acidiphilus]AFM43243.1 hypothetical protein Desaci_4399 [Desulfosporosinus acidiphilus SJ4]
MIYEVCALVATIILGMLGIELIIWIHSIRKLTDEVRHTVHDFNMYMPSMLDDVKVMTGLVRNTTEQVTETVTEVAVGIDAFRKNPLHLVTSVLESIKQIISVWQDFRGRKKEAP